MEQIFRKKHDRSRATTREDQGEPQNYDEVFHPSLKNLAQARSYNQVHVQWPAFNCWPELSLWDYSAWGHQLLAHIEREVPKYTQMDVWAYDVTTRLQESAWRRLQENDIYCLNDGENEGKIESSKDVSILIKEC